jgi:hypothetical protein
MASHYILLRNSDDHVLEEADSTRFRKTGVPPVLKSEKGIRWLDLVVVNPAQGDDQIKEGPTVDITDTTYTRTWTVRDKTAEELNTERTIRADNQFDGFKSLLLVLNDGSFVPGSNYTPAQIKAKLKEKL